MPLSVPQQEQHQQQQEQSEMRQDASTSKDRIDSPSEKKNSMQGSSALDPHLQDLLDQFNQAAQPSTSRVNHAVPLNVYKPVSLFSSWRYVGFLASQASKVASAAVSHTLYGPAKPSWGIEMTVLTTFMRNSVEYSHLSSIDLLRKILDIGRVLPTPRDGIVTPVSFRVKRRNLRGFLQASDAAEDGSRELTAEWVVNRRLWRKMQEEHRADTPSPKAPDQVVLYLHGGAYYVMSAASHRFLTIQVSKSTDLRIFALNYRLSPETRFPGALHDAVSAYLRLVEDLGVPPKNIVLAGDSAGAGLATALLLYLRDENYPLPNCAVLMSPWVDLTMSCASWDTNASFDYLPQPKDDDHLHPVKLFFGPEFVGEFMTHPYASPLFGDFKGLPPLLIQNGDAERLRDEGTLLSHKASHAGVIVEHEVYEDCVHVFQMFGFLDATRKAMRSIRRFVKHWSSQEDMETTRIDSQIMSDAHRVRHGDASLESATLSPQLSEGETSGLGASTGSAPSSSSSTAPSSSVSMYLSSPQRVLRRLPSSPHIATRDSLRRHTRSHTTSTPHLSAAAEEIRTPQVSQPPPYSPASLRVRPRSVSHPSLRALIDDYERQQESQYAEASDYESDVSHTRSPSRHRSAASPLPNSHLSREEDLFFQSATVESKHS